MVAYDATDMASWVKYAQEGDLQALEQLYQESKGLVYRTAYGMVPASMVEDVVQETYLLVQQKLYQLHNPLAFKAWIIRISVHVCHAMLKKLPPIGERSHEEVGPDTSQKVAARLDLMAALESLSLPHRQVLVLREMLELSYQEMGEVLNLPAGTVRSRLHHARNALKAAMTQSPLPPQTAPVVTQ